MPIGDKVRKALDAQANRVCSVCGAPIPGRRVEYCSETCKRIVFQKTKAYRKNVNDRIARRIAENKRQQAIIEEGLEALERDKKRNKPNALTVAIATKSPLPKSVSPAPLQQSDIAPPSSKEMRAHIHQRFGADGYRLIERLENIAFNLKGVQPKVIIDAVKELLDRGWGKTTQSIAVAAVAPVFALPDESKGEALLPDLGNDPPPDVIEAETLNTDQGEPIE